MIRIIEAFCCMEVYWYFQRSFCRGDDRSVSVRIVRNNEWRFYSLRKILEPWRMRQKGRAKLQFFHRVSWRIAVRRLSTHLASKVHALRVFSNRHATRPSRSHTRKSMTSRMPFTDWLVVACRCNREDEPTDGPLPLASLSLFFSARLGLSHSGASHFFSFASSFASTKYDTQLSTRFHHRLPRIPRSNGKNSNFHYWPEINQS